MEIVGDSHNIPRTVLHLDIAEHQDIIYRLVEVEAVRPHLAGVGHSVNIVAEEEKAAVAVVPAEIG